ncbi:endonuclease [Arthrobacter phage Isolde]|uniref:Endonuclease n=1 Tax=Arthrobacter phage Isolde TaxID=2419610 RepID=A0A3G3M3N7_9CAUD|nr:endonuclease [Arthrobacter phage Isolde]AYR01049.1 endonuclease [Arthrobacter phage Isolde]
MIKTAETERTMLDRLNRKYGTFNGNGHRYSRAEHVKISTGFDSPRVCDYMAIDLYNGYGANAGPKLHGHEVKVSRSDWLTELKDPSKAEAFAQYCDYWWLVVSDKAIVKEGELPKGWGLMAVHGAGLTVVKQAIRRAEPVPMGRPLQATLTRAVTKTAVRLAHSDDGAVRQIRQRMRIPEPVTPTQSIR